MNRTQTFLIFLLLSMSSALFGQGWERVFGGESFDLGYSVLQTPNGDFISAGYTTSFGNTNEQIYVIRTDIDGTTIWEKTYGVTTDDNYGYSLIETSDGNYLIAGYVAIDGDNDRQDVYLLKIDPDGNELWNSIIASTGEDYGNRVIETSDNGFAIVGSTRDSLSQQRDILVIKTDADGNEIWTERIGQQLFDVAHAIIQEANGDYILSGYRNIISPTDTLKEAVLIRLNSDGDELNTYPLGATVPVSGSEVIAADDNGYVTAVYNDTSAYFKKVSITGQIEWETEIPDFNLKIGSSIAKTTSGDYVLVGSITSPISPTQDDEDIKIVKLNTEGDIIWDRTHGSPVGNDVARGVIVAFQNGLGIVGESKSFGPGDRDFYLIHTDSLGYSLNNFVTGNVYYDLNEDCNFNTGEYGLNNWLLEVVGDNNTYYGLTNEEGDYRIAVPDGAFVMNLIPLNDYWQSCENNYNLDLNGPYDTTTVDIPLQALYDCPLLEVDISTPFLRRCFDNQYEVNYCNYGTIVAEDAQVIVELDEFFNFINATNTNFTVDGNTYTFDIVEDLEVGECGTFYINVNLDCDATILGQTHCVQAHITPDSICTPAEPCWEGGSIELAASCEGDSVRFIVRNVGNSTIQDGLNYIIVEDHIILNVDGTVGGGLEPDDETIILQPIDGQTLRLEVDQVPCHPGNSTPTITVEGCGLVNQEDISLGYLTQYYEDDSNPFVSIDCQENVGSWDPNDKRGFPKGYENQHYIEANQEMDYHIRFQNTGTDTAFRVVIRDTLSEWLDVRDIQAGAASHAYDYEIYNNNILKITFENIELPDSSTNEVASHGFFKFRIAQQLDNEVGTVIYNSVGIYFDYNEPVITNETFHTIGEDFIEITSSNQPFVPGVYVSLYPNPFIGESTFKITYDDGAVIPDFETKTIQLFDTQGRLIRSEQFTGNEFLFVRKGLAPGLYFFQIENKNNLIFGGKLIAH